MLWRREGDTYRDHVIIILGDRFQPLTVWVSTNDSRVFRRNATLSPPYLHFSQWVLCWFFLGSGLTFLAIDCSIDKKPHTELSTANLLLNILLANEESDPRAEPLEFFSASFCTGVWHLRDSLRLFQSQNYKHYFGKWEDIEWAMKSSAMVHEFPFLKLQQSLAANEQLLVCRSGGIFIRVHKNAHAVIVPLYNRRHLY